MSRAKWKGLFITSQILHHLTTKKKTTLNLFRVWSRSSAVPKFFTNTKVEIYTGKIFKRVWVSIDKIGFKFGEFADTRKHTKHVLRRKLKKK